MNTVTTSFGTSFSIKLGESILDAASSQGISLPYSCRSGRCSTCKCKVISGVSSALHSELGLSDQEKNDGWILSCVRAASTDLVLDIEDLTSTALAPPRTLPCRINSLTLMTKDIVKVVLRLPPTAAFVFLPGQYIDVIGPEGVRRSYSIADADTERHLVELHIRATPDGCMSHYWFHQAKENDLLRFHGPLGTFFLRDLTEVDLIFLATGTGIAPIKAMLESLEHAPLDTMPRSASIYWGNRTESDVYLALTSSINKFQYVPVLSQAHDTWLGARGYVQDIALSNARDLSQSVVYACGSEAMIHSAKALLLQNGLAPQAFYSDAFVCSGIV